MPKRDSQLVSMLEDTADRTRRFLPMPIIGRRAPARILSGWMAIGRTIAGAISGSLDSGRDGPIITIRVAAIGIVMAIGIMDIASDGS